MKREFRLIVSFVFTALLVTPLSVYAETSGKTSDMANGIVISRAIAVPDAKQEQIFEKVCEWVRKNSRFSCFNHDSGNIFAEAEISYPAPSIDRIQYKFLYTMVIALNKNGGTVRFKEIRMKSPETYIQETDEVINGETEQVVLEKDRLAVEKELARLADELEAYVSGGNDKNSVCSVCMAKVSY